MRHKPRTSKGKSMRPNYFVFCEGETEITYVKFLRSIYRVPIQIIPKKSDSNISDKYIENCRREYVNTSNDKIFLMFDLDVEGMLERLQKISEAILLVSNPCIELWFLLHYEEYKGELSSALCVQRLKKFSSSYTKGVLSEEEKYILTKSIELASKRSKSLSKYRNPSSTIFQLIDILQMA